MAGPDASAIAALRSYTTPVHAVYVGFLDILGDPIRVTTAPYDLVVVTGATGDADLDGHTFSAVDPQFISVGSITMKEGGADTVTCQLSGLIGVDTTLLNQIGNKANWQGRVARLWQMQLDESLTQVGAIWPWFTGYMTVPASPGTRRTRSSSSISRAIWRSSEQRRTGLSQPIRFRQRRPLGAGVDRGGKWPERGRCTRSSSFGLDSADAPARRVEGLLMRRYPDWEARLAAYLEGLRDQTFAWGKLDCAIFAGGAVKAMTGFDPMRGLRGYRSEAAAARVLKERGKGTLIRTVNAMFERVPVGFAHRGDLVLVDGGLAVAMGDVALQVGQHGDREGLIRRPRAEWSKAWRVPMPGAAMSKGVLRAVVSPISLVIGKKATHYLLEAVGIVASFIPGGQLIAAAAFVAAGTLFKLTPKTPGVSPTTLDRLNASLNPSAPRTMAFGRTALATDIRYVEPSGTNQEYIDYVVAVASHKATSIEEIWFEDALAWTSAGGVQGAYVSFLTVDTILEGGASAYFTINSAARIGVRPSG
jgi:hypothetical protein